MVPADWTAFGAKPSALLSRRLHAEPAAGFERDAPFGNRLRPARRAREDAEGEEVRGDVAQVAARLPKRTDEGVGRRHAEQLADETGLPRQPLRRCAHAAALRIAQERREVGRAGQSDAHGMLDAEVAQSSDPPQYGRAVEAELRDDMNRHARALGGADLVGKRAVEILLRDAGMTVGIAGDADLSDAVPLQRAAVDHLDRAAELTGGMVAVAGDHQGAPHL